MRYQTSPYAPLIGARAQRRLQTAPCTELQSMSPGVAPPRMAPGAQTRALEKFPRVWNATSRSGRVWKLEANKARAGPGELVHRAQNPLLSEGGALTPGHGVGGSEVAKAVLMT